MTALQLIMPACALITAVLVVVAAREAWSLIRDPDVTRETWLRDDDPRREP